MWGAFRFTDVAFLNRPRQERGFGAVTLKALGDGISAVNKLAN